MEDIRLVLEQTGLLRSSETKVYLSLLKLTESSVSEIAKDAKMHRKNTYDALDRLLEMGLVRQIVRGKQMMFRAEEPSKLHELLEGRAARVAGILPKLKQIYRTPPSDDNVSIVKGRSGVKTILLGILNSRESYVTFGTGGKVRALLPVFYSQYQLRKENAGLHCRAVYGVSAKDTEAVKEFIGELRFAPFEFEGSTTTWIYGSTIAIISWSKEPTGIIITNRDAANSYRSVFEHLWETASPVHRNRSDKHRKNE